MPDDNEAFLVQRMRLGGREADQAYAQLTEAYFGRLHSYVRKRIRNCDSVDDIVQETFIGFVRGLHNYDVNRSLQSWLFSIAAHKITDYIRKASRNREEISQEPEIPFQLEADLRQRKPSSYARNQEQIELEERALVAALTVYIAELKQAKKYKRLLVLELLFVKGMQNKEVAEKLGISEQDVANYRFAAVKKLNQTLKEAGLPATIFPELQIE